METQVIDKARLQWRAAAGLLPQLICLLNGEGRILQASCSVDRWGVGGVTRVKLRYVHDILHPGCADPECYFTRFWQKSAMELQRGRGSECEAFDPILGRHFSIRVQPLAGFPSQESGTEDPHTVLVVDDISGLRQAEAGFLRHTEELEEQVAEEVKQRIHGEEIQMRLLAILEETTDYVAMADAAGSMLYLNPAGRTILGLAPGDDISQMKLCERSDNDVRARLREEAIPTAIRSGIWAGESRLRDSEDREINTSQVIIAHRGIKGQVESFSTIVRNISERVKIEQALRESREELLRLSGLLVTIQEDERRRIALDLHDVLGQSLSLIKLSIENSAGQIAAGDANAALESLHQLVPRVREALLEVRRVASELRPSILDDLGILPTLSWFFREFEASCGHITVEKVINVNEQEVPPSLKITVYRILQEATSNIVRHSGADRVRVCLERIKDVLHLLIEDNGCGFDPARIVPSDGNGRGLGLLSMRERSICSNGAYLIDSAPGRGTRIRVAWPCGQDPG